jgi:hypothetical protein
MKCVDLLEMIKETAQVFPAHQTSFQKNNMTVTVPVF